jgi:hypothetical protein
MNQALYAHMNNKRKIKKKKRKQTNIFTFMEVWFYVILLYPEHYFLNGVSNCNLVQFAFLTHIVFLKHSSILSHSGSSSFIFTTE